MKLINKMERYLNEADYKIIIKNNQLDISNYDEIIDFSSSKIVISSKNATFFIEGLDLAIQKMVDNEVLIIGKITNICIK